MPAYRLDLAYDGTEFRGFARQAAVRTVQGELESALGLVLRTEVELTCSGRTDAGVHARHQVVSFVTEAEVDPDRIARAVTSMLGPEVVVYRAAVVEPQFSARFTATWREYRYRVLNAPVPDPLRRHTTWHLADPLDPTPMNLAAGHLVGEHDFASFCRQTEGRSTVRTVLEAGWSEEGDLMVMTVRASSFCHQMVRSMVGLCVDAGRGRVDPDSVPAVLEARDRTANRPMAPARGLILWEVGFD